MIATLKRSIYKHGYLIITAAWLYTLSFIFINYWSYNASPQKVKANLEQKLSVNEKKIESYFADTALLKNLLQDSLTGTKKKIISDGFGFFVYESVPSNNNQLVFWNNNTSNIGFNELNQPDGAYFVNHQNGAFEYLIRRVIIEKKLLKLVALIPIRWSYFIENKYLQSSFDGFPELNKQYEISVDSSALPVFNSTGIELFKIKLKEGKSFIAYDSITIFLRTLAIILLLFFLHAIAEEIVQAKGFSKGFLALLATVILLRALSYQFSIPFDFAKVPLFDPSIYAASSIHPSLGDLLVNSVLLFWLVNFYQKNNRQSLYNYLSIKMPEQFIYGCSIFIITIIGLWEGNLITSLVKDSKISFDSTNFFSLSIYTVIAFVVLCFLVLFFYYISQLLLKQSIVNKQPVFHQLIVATLTGFVYFILFVKANDTVLNMVILAWILLYIFILNVRKKDIQVPLTQSAFFIFWVLYFAMSIATIVMYENTIVEQAQRKKIAEKLALQTDPSGENLLNIAAANIDDAFLSNNYYRFQIEALNKYLKDSLINENFSGYLNKYDTRIYTYDSLYRPIFNEDATTYASIKSIILNQAKQTVIAGLFSFENTQGGFSFLYQKEVKEGSFIKGYLYVLIKSKRYKSEALYPELFNQTQDLPSDLNTNYAYAVYSKGRLINHFNNYDFPSQLNEAKFPGFENTFKQVGNFSELWYNSGNRKLVLVVKKSNWLLESITLFAYLFCSFLLIIFLFQGTSFLLASRFRWAQLKLAFRFNIRSQIQATILFLSLFSFIVIGIATISFFILRFNRNNEERLSKSIQVMANEIDTHVKMQFSTTAATAVYHITEVADLEKKIAEISDSHNVDINFYDTKGSLQISTQPYIYNKHLLSEQMHPIAFFELHHNKSIRFIQSEQVGLFTYLSIYVPLLDAKGNAYAYLNIPYLNSHTELTQEISGFLATLINLNAFIFLIAGAIAFLLTNRITNSFTLIAEKMQQLNLSQINEVISWNRNDEIGVLVAEYNKMVNKLAISAAALAQSEREGAWREMARQVAHEIKNPLTPMKLSIQYLQKAIQEDSENVKQLSQKMAETLIEQIDQLSKIAGDFSQFANIGQSNFELFDINELLRSLVNLYEAYPNVTILTDLTNQAVMIRSDKLQINRLFTNLIKNAIEAGEAKPNAVVININVQLEKTAVIIEVIDNAGGIPTQMVEHIFQPNFTTKSSGTGLGLAICKGIVEKAKGNIWFETKAGEGTQFNIKLPLA